MGSDDLFKKRREERKKRKFEYKPSRANSFLIITEGEKTEPLYIRGLAKLIEDKLGGSVDVYEMPLIDVTGEGCATNKLIEKTEEIVNKAKVIYQNIWVVFDKDDFTDFDQAIINGRAKGYHIAWSNQSFEYWLYLHFEYSDSALHRKEWVKKLNKSFKEYGLGNGTYQKNYKDIYSMVNSNEGVKNAINNAKRRMSQFDEKKNKPSEFNPGTTMHLLIEELKKYLDE